MCLQEGASAGVLPRRGAQRPQGGALLGAHVPRVRRGPQVHAGSKQQQQQRSAVEAG